MAPNKQQTDSYPGEVGAGTRTDSSTASSSTPGVTPVHLRMAVNENTCLLYESDVRKHLAELQQIYRHAPIGLIFVDRRFRVTRINERFATILGLPLEELLGNGSTEASLLLPDQMARICHQVIGSGEAVLDVEIPRIDPNTNQEHYWLCRFFRCDPSRAQRWA